MSTPRGFRLAIEACRPCTVSKSQSRRTWPLRAFATSRISQLEDITQGFPVPRPSQSLPETVRQTEQATSEQPKSREASSAADDPTSIPTSVATPSSSTIPEATKIDAPSIPTLSRPPLNVLAAYHIPLRHEAQYGVPTCDLQLRSYSVRNLDVMADFALRAAYYLKLPASGPVPLPKKIERWTVLRSNFVHKKSQENFERITHKRLIQIRDGHPDVVEIWLSFLRRHQFYGVGMKANVWEYEGLDVTTKMDQQMKEVEKDLDAKLGLFGWNKQAAGTKSISKMLQEQGARGVGMPMTDVREASRTKDSSA